MQCRIAGGTALQVVQHCRWWASDPGAPSLVLLSKSPLKYIRILHFNTLLFRLHSASAAVLSFTYYVLVSADEPQNHHYWIHTDRWLCWGSKLHKSREHNLCILPFFHALFVLLQRITRLPGKFRILFWSMNFAAFVLNTPAIVGGTVFIHWYVVISCYTEYSNKTSADSLTILSNSRLSLKTRSWLCFLSFTRTRRTTWSTSWGWAVPSSGRLKLPTSSNLAIH